MFRSRLQKISVLMLGAFLLMACSVFAVSPTPVATLVFATRTSVPQAETGLPAATPTQAPTNTPIPTTEPPTTATGVPTNIPPTRNPDTTLNFDSAQNAYRVEFGAGGTWAQFDGQLNESGESIRYVLGAMQGQKMGISIVEGIPFSVEVSQGNEVISGAQEERSFWYGTLPTTGDYVVTVSTQTPGSYTLRITINPPEQANQYFDYQHSLFTLRYSDEFSPTSYIPVGDYKGTPALVLNFINVKFYRPTTNLSEAYFMVNTSSDLTTCTQAAAPGEAVLGEKVFNSNTFVESQSVGVAAGNIYEELFYRAVLNETCYEIVFFMHSGNIGNYTPGTVVEFDRAALLEKFESVLETFEIN